MGGNFICGQIRPAEKKHLVAHGGLRHMAHIHHALVHTYTAHHRGTLPTQQHLRLAAQHARVSVSIANGDGGKAAFFLRVIDAAVAHAHAGRNLLDHGQPRLEAHDGTQINGHGAFVGRLEAIKNYPCPDHIKMTFRQGQYGGAVGTVPDA